MSRKNIRSHFAFNKQERSGIFYLILLIFVVFVLNHFLSEWIPAREPAFRIDEAAENKLKQRQIADVRHSTLYPFNPNYLTDFRAYYLGMETDAIDRLLAHRSKGLLINSPEEFQRVTGISDSLQDVLKPYMKFPERRWSGKTQNSVLAASSTTRIDDLNSVTAEELMKLRGIGKVLSARIIKFRDRLGGFIEDDQLYEVYGLDREVAARVLTRYSVLKAPLVIPVNVNEATVEDLQEVAYISWSFARQIVAYREEQGSITSWDELTELEDFPKDKIERIKVYLSL